MQSAVNRIKSEKTDRWEGWRRWRGGKRKGKWVTNWMIQEGMKE